MAEDLVILGAGGTAGDIAWNVEEINRVEPRWTLRGFLDDDSAKQGTSIAGYPVLGPLSAAGDFDGARFLIGIAHYRRPLARKQLFDRIGLAPERFATLVHPTASVSPHARVGAGTVIFQNVVVCHGAVVGSHVFVLALCVVSHDAVVQDFATMTSGVVLCGGARLAVGAYAGARSVIRDGVTIGEGSVAALGSVVVRDVAPNRVVVGNPAREIPGSSPGMFA
jgi:sugar O-acyltransferase (sialic acid O-acetyltransferase NeuD family)